VGTGQALGTCQCLPPQHLAEKNCNKPAEASQAMSKGTDRSSHPTTHTPPTTHHTFQDLQRRISGFSLDAWHINVWHRQQKKQFFALDSVTYLTSSKRCVHPCHLAGTGTSLDDQSGGRLDHFLSLGPIDRPTESRDSLVNRASEAFIGTKLAGSHIPVPQRRLRFVQ
jgi:hypothetical protein